MAVAQTSASASTWELPVCHAFRKRRYVMEQQTQDNSPATKFNSQFRSVAEEELSVI